MLISTSEELQRYLPSSVYDDTDTLVVLTERAERKHLVPVLGDELYEYLCAQYDDIKDDEGGITPDIIDMAAMATMGEEKKTIISLLRLCQSAVAYFTVADNAGQLSLSFNQGNGLAQVNTDGYTAATEETFKRFISDVWHQARQDIDDICKLLERVAMSVPTSSTSSSSSTSSPLGGTGGGLSSSSATGGGLSYPLTIVNRWRKSDWFYFQGDLLLTTARDTLRYVTKDEQPFSYKEYVDILGELRTRQEASIAPELGDTLMQALVRSQYDNTITIDPIKGGKVLHLLRMALMSFLRYSRTDKPKYDHDARLFLFRAIEVIRDNQSSFSPYVESAPFYVAPPAEDATDDVDEEEETIDQHPTYGESEDSVFNPFGV